MSQGFQPESKESKGSQNMRVKNNKGYHKLLIWQKARQLVILIYKYTENLPKAEEFGLKGQLRRASVSIVLTIVEGHRKASKKEFLHYLDMSVISAAEVEAALELSLDLGFIDSETYSIVETKRAEVAFLLGAFIKGLRK